MDVAFTVRGLPPKKDGAGSLWRKDPEVRRVIALRLAARAALGDRPALDRDIRLTLTVHLARDARRAGDLDNMVAGVLDALQRAPAGTPWEHDPRWQAEAVRPVRPDAWAAIADDGAVVGIVARKLVGSVAPGGEWYAVALASPPPPR